MFILNRWQGGMNLSTDELTLVYVGVCICMTEITSALLAGGLLSLPEPEEELRPGTAMVSSSPEGEVDPIASQCRHRTRKGR
jgi:hypothetical protein